MSRATSKHVTLEDDEIGVATILEPSDPSIAFPSRAHVRRVRPPDVGEDPPASFATLPSRALTTCLAPYSAEELGEHWGRRHLHIRRGGAPDRFRDVLSLETLDALLAEQRIPRETISVLDARKSNRAEFGCLDPRSPIGSDLASAGASLYFHFLDQFSPTLREFCDEIETSLGMPLAAFAFLNPPRAQARALHWDPLDVIILQVEGEKIWDIHAPHVKLPLAVHDSSEYVFDTPRIARVKLEPGDTLYVPRGFIHKAESTHDISWSITLGVQSMAWHDLLRAATTRGLQAARAERRMRSALPGWSSSNTEWPRMVDATIELARRVARPPFVRELALNHHREFEGPRFHLTPGYITSAYVEDDELGALRFSRTPTPFRLGLGDDGATWELKQNGYCFLVSAPEAECMKWMRQQRRSFSTRDLARRFPKVELRELLQRLLAVGFVRAGQER